MKSRTALQTLLETLCANVYFQPPAAFQMEYPCIVYQLNDFDTKFADNRPYSLEKQYMLTIMDRNPDSTIPEAVAALPKCVFDRHYVTEGLNHNVFVIYF